MTQERDGGVRLQARVAGSGTTIATTMAATLDQAVETMLALPQVAAVAFERYEVAANGVSQTSETTSANVLTGRDTYTSTGLVVLAPISCRSVIWDAAPWPQQTVKAASPSISVSMTPLAGLYRAGFFT